MNTFVKRMIGLGIIAGLGSPAWAGDLTIPNSFTADTPAVAAEVNVNFDAVEQEVDDNNARINTNNSNIDANRDDIDRNTDSTNLNDDRISTLELLHQTLTHTVSYAGSVFIPSHPTIGVNTNPDLQRSEPIEGYNWATDTGAQYRLLPLNLPNGSEVTDLTCYYYDNDAVNDMNLFASIREYSLAAGVRNNYLGVTSSPTTAGTSTMIYNYSSSGSFVIDNTENAYVLYTYSALFGGSEDIRFYGCTVTYNN